MTDPIRPVGASNSTRRVAGRTAVQARKDGDAGAEAEHGRRLPVPIIPDAPADEAAQEPSPKSRRAALAAFAAQLIGQGGQKRGLRGGAETLGQARTTYLETEWSGPSDRRLQTGQITKTEV
jgi:hypothetical protein